MIVFLQALHGLRGATHETWNVIETCRVRVRILLFIVKVTAA